MKKLCAILVSALMLTVSAITFTGCKKEATAERVMNISCNPSVEFVLDSNDKVISVNALNEEGNLILTAETFVGLEADVAAKLFVEVSKETGFIVSGNAQYGENQIEISLSGDSADAKKIYDQAKASIDAYLNQENITASLTQAEAITREQLKNMLAQCAPNLEQAEIDALEYMELVEEIYESRQETAEYYSQELKNAYYQAKAFAMEQAELDVLKSKANAAQQIILESAFALYTSAVQYIENIRLTQLVAENSPYQLALAAFRDAKIDYLKYREQVANMEQSEITAIVQDTLDNYEQILLSAEQALISAGESANALLDSASANVTATYNTVVDYIEQFSIQINSHLTEISKKQTEAQNAFFTNFETSYATAINSARNNWTAMKTELENKTQA